MNVPRSAGTPEVDESQYRAMELLLGVVQELSTARSLESVTAIVRQAARRLTGADGATFILRDDAECFYVDEDAIAPLWKGRRFPMSSCAGGWTMRHGEPLVVEDVYASPIISTDAYRPTFVKSLALVPIRSANPIGAIGAYWAAKYRPTAHQIRLLQGLADSTSIALENVRLYAELESQIQERTSALTSARLAEDAARRELEERLRAEALLRDIEEQLRQSQKMEAVGQLAGGIAHDFNNMLSVILTYSSMVLSELKSDDPLHDEIAQIQMAGERASRLTRQLLAFSRQQILEPLVLDVNGVVGSMIKMLPRLLGEDIDLVTRLEPEIHRVLVDPGQIEQVIMNLAVNARDAMPRGGTLTIRTANARLTGEQTNYGLRVTDGDYAVIWVSDTGHGMDSETQNRIFEPFFTTKEKGRGTGLGLSTVYGIVKQSGGHVWVHSELGAGTTFKIYLPKVVNSEPRSSAARGAELAPVLGDEMVLLVEDDDQVRGAAAGILRRAGYTVAEAKAPEVAIELCEQRGAEIRLLVTDVVMPRISGVELAKRLRAEQPELKVLCISGFTDEAVLRHGLFESGLLFLQKPITPRLLLAKVRQALDA